jgi:hypothetical protein
MVMLNGYEENKLLIGNTYRKAFFEKKAQKMIKKKAGIQILSYSRLASAIITIAGVWMKFQLINELNIQF